ncbi:NrsF family protein [Blastomonas sp.]|uniref:NrsF family protein n=1 Tax=Blastomonas sp. TaxID=1909299 RepID=UPI003593A85D
MTDNQVSPAPSGARPFDVSVLADDIAPVTPMRLRTGLMLTALMSIIATVAVALAMGVREDVAALSPDRMFMIRAGALLMIGVAAAVAALSTATPRIGRPTPKAWKWALMLAGLLPLGALISLLNAPSHDAQSLQAKLDPQYGLECLRISALCALGIAAVMVLWLRRGAPTSPERTAWLIGLAAGAFGASAYSVYCPATTLVYIGTWYSLAVAMCAVAGRIILPPLLRW